MLAAALFVLTAGVALAQSKPAPVPPKQPPPSPERVYPGAVDRPLGLPDVLAEDRIDLDHGVEIGLGPQAVALHFPKLKVDDNPGLNISEGVAISADMLLGNLRLGYSRQFYRRTLKAATFEGQRANFVSVDSDEFLATLGWRPLYSLFLGVIGGGEYRLVQVKEDTTSLLTQTETTGLIGVMADLVVARQFSLQVRVLRETADRLVRLDSTIIELSYLIPL